MKYIAIEVRIKATSQIGTSWSDIEKRTVYVESTAPINLVVATMTTAETWEARWNHTNPNALPGYLGQGHYVEGPAMAERYGFVWQYREDGAWVDPGADPGVDPGVDPGEGE